MRKANVKLAMRECLSELIIAESKKLPIEREAMTDKIEYFRHERLIHLIVTMTTSICAIILISASAVSNGTGLEGVALFVAGLIMLILDVAYLAYYFFLENTLQLINELFIKLK